MKKKKLILNTKKSFKINILTARCKNFYYQIFFRNNKKGKFKKNDKEIRITQ